MTSVPRTVRDMPAVDRALLCSLPLLFRYSAYPDLVGIWGTATAIKYNGHDLFLTARHVVKDVDETCGISVATGFGRPPVECEIDTASYRTPNDPEFSAVSDVAILRPAAPPVFQDGSTCSFDLEGPLYDFDGTSPGLILAVRGYPREDPRNRVDLAAGRIDFLAHAAIGRYGGPSGLYGCHKVEVDTAVVGGPQGFSGCPVFAATKSEGIWWPHLAGIVLRGSPSLIHVLDVKALLVYLKDTVGPPKSPPAKTAI